MALVWYLKTEALLNILKFSRLLLFSVQSFSGQPTWHVWANKIPERWRSANQQPLLSAPQADPPNHYRFFYFGGCVENMAENLKGKTY